jgi:hypothetical protein
MVHHDQWAEHAASSEIGQRQVDVFQWVAMSEQGMQELHSVFYQLIDPR